MPKWLDSFVNLFRDQPELVEERPAPPRPSVSPTPRRLQPSPLKADDVEPALYADVVVDFGTSATVIATVESDALANSKRLNCLVGADEFSSSVAVANGLDGTPEVIAIGRDAAGALQRDTTGRVRYFASLKRYIELTSRRSDASNDLAVLGQLVEEYLRKAIESAYGQLRRQQRIQAQSRIVVSVPNDFNGLATDVVRGGAYKALASLARQHGDEPPPMDRVEVVREGEAAAYCFLETMKGAVATVGASQRLGRDSWVVLNSLPAGEPSGWQRIAVLDVGAGTTDLTVLQRSTSDGRPWSVVFNSGVPLGGFDVDKRLLASLTMKPMEFWPSVTISTRVLGLQAAAARKIQNGTNDFFQGPWESFAETMVGGAREALVLGAGRDAAAAAAKRDIGIIVQMSASGLMGLLSDNVPLSGGPPLDAIVLTGRGSLLSEFRAETMKFADRWNCPLFTTSDQVPKYYLKLAVAVGCAFVPLRPVFATREPAGTLGREIRVHEWHGAPLARITSGVPVSGVMPEVWMINTPHPEGDYPQEWFLSERRVHLDNQLADADGGESLRALGVLRQAAKWRSEPGQSQPARPVTILRDATTDSYYRVKSRDGLHSWLRIDEMGLDRYVAVQENPFTKLPFGFGDE